MSSSEPPSLPPSFPSSIPTSDDSEEDGNHETESSNGPPELPPSIPSTEHSKTNDVAISVDKDQNITDEEHTKQNCKSEQTPTHTTDINKNEKEIEKLHADEELNFSRLQPHEYVTPQVLALDDHSMSLVNIILHICVILVIGYCIISNGTYMEIDYAMGSAVLNLEGTAKADLSESNMGTMAFDQYDLRIPEQERNALFVATHIIGFKEQQRTNTNGDQLKCVDETEKCPCNNGEFIKNGVATGNCIRSKCEMTGWCTAKKNNEDTKNLNLEIKYNALLDGVEEMLVTFQISVEFAKFGVNKVVTLKERIAGYNIWRIGDILKGINEIYTNVRDEGVIIVVNMNWKCDYYNTNDKCDVEWSLFRADNANTKNGGIHLWSSNYQTPEIVEINGMKLKVLESRYLQKIYGVKILFNVTGEMKRFSIVALLINIGSMAGILSIIPTILDFMLKRRRADLSQMKHTDMDERAELYSKMVKQLLLEYLKGQEADE